MNNFNGVNNMGNQVSFNSNSNNLNRSTFPTYFNSTSQAIVPTNNIVWVQGIEGAKAYQLNPNSVAILLDSEEEGKMYIKISDNIGMCSLRVFDYKEVSVTNKTPASEGIDLSQYVTKAELDELVKEIKEILTNDKTVSATSKKSTTTSSNAAPKQQQQLNEDIFAKF